MSSRSAAAALPAAWARARSWGDAIAAVPPAPFLAALVVVQLLLTLRLALEIPHNGWIWYSGGDATEYWTEQWAIAHGHLPQAVLGYGINVLYAWAPFLAGPTLLTGVPLIVLFHTLVLVPLAVVLVWAIADRLGGRVFAWWAAAAWIVAPLLLVRGFRPDFRDDFKTYFLGPHAFGLTDMADFPSLVVILASAWATLRALDTRRLEDAVLAGLLAGFAVGIKPGNTFFLAAPFLGLAIARRWLQGAVWAASLVPALVTLTIWKDRGRGYVPSAPPSGGPVPSAGPLARFTNYLDFSWAHFSDNLDELRELFWSLRLLEFLAVAGAVALIRRAGAKGVVVVAWFGAYCILKGGSPLAQVPSTTYFRLTTPGLAAYFLLAASIVLLVPGWGRYARTVAAPAARSFRPGRPLIAAAVVLALVPFVAVVAASPAPAGLIARHGASSNEAPISDAFALTARPAGEGVRLSWRAPGTGRSSGFFLVYRAEKGDGCTLPGAGAQECQLEMQFAGQTRGTSFEEGRARGRYWYRVALAANYLNDGNAGGDLMLLSHAVDVTVP
jgi:hypothetical protein